MIDRQGRFINLLGAGRMIPTVAVYVPRTDRLYFGSEAVGLREPGMEAGKFFKVEIKRNPGYHLGPFNLTEIITQLLKWLYQQYVAKKAEPVQTVNIGIPNYFGLKARQVVLAAAHTVFSGVPIRLVPEPLAALVGLLREWVVGDQASLMGNLMVVDIGGGTADVSFVHLSRSEGTRAILEAHLQSGSDVFSGAEVDKAVLRQVLIPRFELETGQRIASHLKKEKGIQGGEGYRYARMLSRAEEIKIGLAEKDEIRVDIPDFYRGRSLNTVLMQEDMRPALDSTLRTLRQFIKSEVRDRARQAGLYNRGCWQFDQVVLMGGASRLPGVREVLAELGVKILQPREPEFYVVRGLSALVGSSDGPGGLEMRVIFPFRFYIEKRKTGKFDSRVLEAISFDTANLELDPDGIYRLFSVPFDSAYNLGREDERFEIRVYQGEEGGEEAVDRIRIDNESLVLDFSARREDIEGEMVDIYLDLGASCLRTSREKEAEQPGKVERDGKRLWQEALGRQESTTAAARYLQGQGAHPALNNFAERLQVLKEGSPYQNYDDFMVAKLLAFFEVLTHEKK